MTKRMVCPDFGGVHVMAHCVTKLRKLIRSGEVAVTVVDPPGHRSGEPTVTEPADGVVERRFVADPLGQVLNEVPVLIGRVKRADHRARNAEFLPIHGPTSVIPYDILVTAGLITLTLPIPGLPSTL